MSGRVVYLDGRFVPENQARISIFDSALVIGDMAFESTRTFLGEPFELRSHLERLFGTLEILEIDCGLSREEVQDLTRETLSRNRETEAPDVDWQIIHNISSGLADPFRTAFGAGSPTVSINCWPLIPQLARMAPFYEAGVCLVIPEQRALPPEWINPRAKTRSRVHVRLAQIQAHRLEPFSWPVLLDTRGFLAEGTSWNIFLVHGGRLLTPSTRNVLPGISRQITLELAREQGIPAEETDISPEQALGSDEMFCTATSFCALPVRSLNGTRIGKEGPGPVTRRLMDAWCRRVGLDFVAEAQEYADGLADWLAKEKAARGQFS